MFIIPHSVPWENPTPDREPELITQDSSAYQQTVYSFFNGTV